MKLLAHLRARARPLLALAGSAIVLLIFAEQVRVEHLLAERHIGFQTDVDGKPGLAVVEVTAGDPGARAGLVAGDRLFAIDGVPVSNDATYDAAARRFVRGAPVVFTVEHLTRRIDLSMTPGGEMPWSRILLNLIGGALYLGLALLAFFQHGDDLRSALLAGFSYAIAIELVLPEGVSESTMAGVVWMVAFLWISGVQLGLELHLSSLIPERAPWLRRLPWVAPVYYAIGLGIALFASATHIARAVGQTLPWSVDFADSLFFERILPLWAIAVTALVGSRIATHPEPRGRAQAGLVLLGLLPWAVWTLANPVRAFFGWPPLASSGVVDTLVLFAYPVAVFIAIFRYHLFDIELVIKRGFLYTSLTSLLILVFYGALGAGGALFARFFEPGRESVWALAAATLVLGLLFNPLRQRLHRWIDRRVFPERQALRTRLVALAGELPAKGKLPLMGEHLVEELTTIFDVESVTIWISAPPVGQLVNLASTREGELDAERTLLLGPDDRGVQLLASSRRPLLARALATRSRPLGDRLAEAHAEYVVPLTAQGQLVGAILLDQKRSGERFVAEEMELLTLLAHHVATVFENARLFESATFEALTGLYRREAILEILDREWSRSLRYDRPLTVALVDLDHFKRVNDRFGHMTGDLVLQKVAAAVKGQLRAADALGRFGGEEFLIVLPETELAGAVAFADKIRQLIEQLAVPVAEGGEVRITLSIGLASRGEIREETHPRSRALLAAADAALYAAKRKGRNRVEASNDSRVA